MGNVLCEILDRDAGLDTADVGLREHQPIEGDVARWGQLDLLNGLCHVSFSENRRPRASLSAFNPFTNSGRPSSSLAAAELDLRRVRIRATSMTTASKGDLTE